MYKYCIQSTNGGAYAFKAWQRSISDLMFWERERTVIMSTHDHADHPYV